MNRTFRCFVAYLVLAAAFVAAASVAEAVPPLPQPRVDAVRREAPPGTPQLILTGILDEISAPLTWNGNEQGYYARTVHGLDEIVGSERVIGDLPIVNEPLDRPFGQRGQGRPDNPPGGHDNPPGRPNEIVEVREPSGAALLVIGMVGLLLAARPRKTR